MKDCHVDKLDVSREINYTLLVWINFGSELWECHGAKLNMHGSEEVSIETLLDLSSVAAIQKEEEIGGVVEVDDSLRESHSAVRVPPFAELMEIN